MRNWCEYEAGLRNRGSLTVWISLIQGKLENWDAPRPKRRKPGRPATNSPTMFTREMEVMVPEEGDTVVTLRP